MKTAASFHQRPGLGHKIRQQNSCELLTEESASKSGVSQNSYGNKKGHWTAPQNNSHVYTHFWAADPKSKPHKGMI